MSSVRRDSLPLSTATRLSFTSLCRGRTHQRSLMLLVPCSRMLIWRRIKHVAAEHIIRRSIFLMRQGELFLKVRFLLQPATAVSHFSAHSFLTMRSPPYES